MLTSSSSRSPLSPLPPTSALAADERLDLDDGRWEDVHVITGALKLFFRELPEPLFPFSHFHQFIAAISECPGRWGGWGKGAAGFLQHRLGQDPHTHWEAARSVLLA